MTERPGWLAEILDDARRTHEAVEVATLLSGKTDDAYAKTLLVAMQIWARQMYGDDYREFRRARGTALPRRISAKED